jgi:hypothetical protein
MVLLNMMSIPFFTAFAAIALAWFGQRIAAMVTLLVTIAVITVLFRLHATDVLNLDL